MVGHTGSQRTIHTPLTKKRLLEITTEMFPKRETCLLCKPNTQNNRGTHSPSSKSTLVHRFDFNGNFNNFDFVLTIVCG